MSGHTSGQTSGQTDWSNRQALRNLGSHIFGPAHRGTGSARLCQLVGMTADGQARPGPGRPTLTLVPLPDLLKVSRARALPLTLFLSHTRSQPLTLTLTQRERKRERERQEREIDAVAVPTGRGIGSQASGFRSAGLTLRGPNARPSAGACSLAIASAVRSLAADRCPCKESAALPVHQAIASAVRSLAADRSPCRAFSLDRFSGPSRVRPFLWGRHLARLPLAVCCRATVSWGVISCDRFFRSPALLRRNRVRCIFHQVLG